MSKTNVTYTAIIAVRFIKLSLIKKERSLVSKNSNSLKDMIKSSSVTINNNHLKKIGFIATAIIMLSVTATFGFSPNEDVFAKKPQAVIDWSNGFPSGEHSTMNIHGKKVGFNCDNSLEGTELYGSSIFVQLYGISEINIVSNKRSSITEGKAIDPCAAPFGSHSVDPALYQLPTGEHQVYWRIMGIPNNGNGQDGNDGSSEARITSPTLIDQCNFLPVAFEDGTIVQSFDPDAVDGLVLIAFNGNEMYVESGDFAGFDNLDSIYRDNFGGTADFVDAGDDYLYGPMVATDSTVPLLAFDPNVKHEDTGDTLDEFDQGETVYLSADAVVSEGDTRLANASSQGLPDTEGGDATDCGDAELVGLGLINNKGVFKKEGEKLERFGEETGKGKSKAKEITDLFLWTGAICDASILDTWDTDGSTTLTMADFEDTVDGIITADDLNAIVGADLVVDAQVLIDQAEAAALADPKTLDGDVIVNGEIDTQAEFAYFLEIQFGTEFNCEAFVNEWVFNVADIVLYGFNYENFGASITQIRYYPTATAFD